MNLSLSILVAFVVGFVSSRIALRRGRNQYLWFVIGFIFGVLGLLAIFLAPPARKKAEPEAAPSKIELQPYIDGPIDRFWYYLDKARQQQGPMSHNALSQAWKTGQIDLSTFVWHEDLPNWTELKEFVRTDRLDRSTSA